MLEFLLRDGSPSLLWEGRPLIDRLELDLQVEGRRLTTADGGLRVAGSWPLAGEDPLGSYRGLGLVYTSGTTELLELRLRAYPERGWAVAELEALQELEGTAVADSFLHTTFNLVFHLCDGKFLLYTWGLRHADEGGRWPEGRVGQGLGELPEEPFAPVAIWTDEGALALAPLSYFLTSPLRPWPALASGEGEGKGEEKASEHPPKRAVAHGFHGSVRRIPQGTILRSGLAVVEKPDPIAALYSLGELLLELGGKGRPGPLDDLLLERLSYWNDYGAYYSEVFNPIDEGVLLQLGEYFAREGIPVGYFGLDLWYHFDRVGWATRYEPRGEKFPRGLGPIARETKLPFLLHLSAFAPDFQPDGYKHPFLRGERASLPAEPRRFYRELGSRLREEEGACGIWHDWLWAQQDSAGELRSDPELAERWFTELAEAFAEVGLPVLLCMPTMGFHLASTRHKNIIAARSYCDYLNTQPGQVERARSLGSEAELIPPQRYLRQNVLVGAVLHALGLYPFYDIFITNGRHPEGFAEAHPQQKALFCALSAGPVGIGDKLGQVDKEIVERLTLPPPDGRLAKPDRPPWPLPEFLEGDLLVAYTETSVEADSPDAGKGEEQTTIRWRYLLVANLGEAPLDYSLEPAKLLELELEGDYLIYDCLGGRLAEGVEGTLPPGELGCFLLAPRWGKLGLIGLERRYIPFPCGLFRTVGYRPSEGRLRLKMRAEPGTVYPILAWSEASLSEEWAVHAAGGEVISVKVRPNTGLAVITVRAAEPLLQLELGVSS